MANLQMWGRYGCTTISELASDTHSLPNFHTPEHFGQIFLNKSYDIFILLSLCDTKTQIMRKLTLFSLVVAALMSLSDVSL